MIDGKYNMQFAVTLLGRAEVTVENGEVTVDLRGLQTSTLGNIGTPGESERLTDDVRQEAGKSAYRLSIQCAYDEMTGRQSAETPQFIMPPGGVQA